MSQIATPEQAGVQARNIIKVVLDEFVAISTAGLLSISLHFLFGTTTSTATARR